MNCVVSMVPEMDALFVNPDVPLAFAGLIVVLGSVAVFLRRGWKAAPWVALSSAVFMAAAVMIFGYVRGGRRVHEVNLLRYPPRFMLAEAVLPKPRIQLAASSDEGPDVAHPDVVHPPVELPLDAQPATDSPSQPRPGWVDEEPRRIGHVLRQVISAGPYPEVDDCYELLDEKLMVLVRERLAELTSSTSAPEAGALGITTSYLRREICRDEFVETTEHSFGSMKSVYLLVEFDQNFDRYLLSRFRDHQRNERMANVGVLSSGVIGVLGLVYGLLKVDNWTKRRYTTRLFVGVPLAVAIGMALVSLAN
jgi:hypothetical protein